jgi:hypothetical protein
MIISGWTIHYLRKELHWDTLKVYRAVFWGYAAFGVLKLILSLALSKAVEAEKKTTPPPYTETAPLLGDAAEDDEPKSKFRSLLPNISAESKVIVLNLCLLFALDAFASGLAPLSVFYLPVSPPC